MIYTVRTDRTIYEGASYPIASTLADHHAERREHVTLVVDDVVAWEFVPGKVAA